MVFKINNIDFGKNIVAGTYSVNQEDGYISWTNANFKEVRVKTNSKVKGTFDIFFKTIAEYQAFKDAVDASLRDDMTHLAMLSVNNLNKIMACDVFIEYELNRNLNGAMQDFYEPFTVTITEA